MTITDPDSDRRTAGGGPLSGSAEATDEAASVRLPLPSAAVAPPAAPGRLRVALCAITIAATVPYLALKLLWVCGSNLGIHDTPTHSSSMHSSSMHSSSMHSGAMTAANLLTIAMDAAAAAVALTLVRPWGHRIPAWLLIFPMWVATGFLAPVAIGAPTAALAAMVTGQDVAGGGSSAGETLSPWVFTLVYGGFGVQGVGLAAGFVLHARARWSRVFHLRLRDLPGTGVVDGVRRTMVTGVAAFALIPIVAHFYWAAGGTAGHPMGPDGTAARFAVESVFGLLPLVGVGGALILARRRDGAPARWALAAAWTGTSTMFAWGLWWVLAGSVRTTMTEGEDLRGVTGVGAMQMLAGAVLATVLALLVVEAAATRNQPAEHSTRGIR